LVFLSLLRGTGSACFLRTKHGGTPIRCQRQQARSRSAAVSSATSDVFQRQEGNPDVTNLLLRLYIAGPSATSRRAEQNLLRLQDVAKAKDGLEVEVIDVLRNPELDEQAAIIATPTLAYEHPIRPRRIVGDLSDVDRILDFLGIESEGNKV
jgi:circadian clock protein KaiB